MVQERQRLNQQIYEEATEWLIRHRAGALDVADRKVFDAWLRRSPEHIRAYFEMSAVWEDTAAIDPLSAAPAAELIERAAGDQPIVPMPEMQESAVKRKGANSDRSMNGVPQRRRVLPHRFRFGGAIAAAAAVAALAGWWLREPGYSTGIAEQRSITLADGSVVELNARSEIRVHFVPRERDVDLVRGQALFHVTKDPARPFIVRAGTTLVRAVGTQFDVNELHGATVVTVVEGLVAVFGTPGSPGAGSVPLNSDAIPPAERVTAELTKGLRGQIRPIFLGSGQQLTVMGKRLQETLRVNLTSATAWTQHRFVFDGAPLTEVVDELNRYNVRQLVIADPRLDDLRINGFFSSTDPSLLLQFLRSQPEITVQDVGDQIRISKK